MSTSGSIGEEPAVFSHHVRALLARQRREDEEAIAGSLKRTGFRAQTDEREGRGSQRHAVARGRERTVDFHAASPLTRRDRQTGGFRVPHFDVKAVVAIHPPSRNGVARPCCCGGGMSAAAHFDYVTDGARIGLATHIDYIRRETGVADPAGEMLLDMLDEQVMRAELNRLACFTNIPGGWDRARNLFEAAERAAPPPKSHLLQASTAQVTSFEYQLKFGGAPTWFREMTRRLQAEAAEVEREAIERGRPARHRTVTIAEVSGDEAYERLDWFARRPFAGDLVTWKQGRTQRSQHRFVGELPDDLSPIDRHEILSRFCGTLADDGWMVVGAIHQPDRHNDRRNFHLHVDGVDRPAEWLDAYACWDFEYVERRNGKDTRPYRQNKVRYDAPPAGILRERFITIVNEVGVAGSSPMVIGTTSVSPIVAPIASPTVAPDTHIAARQADRKPDISGSPLGTLPNRVAPSGADRAGSTSTRGASTDRAPHRPDTVEKSKAKLFDQASSLPTAGAKRVASKGPARSATPVVPRTKGPER